MSTPTKTRKTSSKLLTVFERAVIVTGSYKEKPHDGGSAWGYSYTRPCLEDIMYLIAPCARGQVARIASFKHCGAAFRAKMNLTAYKTGHRRACNTTLPLTTLVWKGD